MSNFSHLTQLKSDFFTLIILFNSDCTPTQVCQFIYVYQTLSLIISLYLHFYFNRRVQQTHLGCAPTQVCQCKAKKNHLTFKSTKERTST